MFEGQHEHSLDDKFRVVLPAAIRKEISDHDLGEGGLTLTIGRRRQWLNIEPRQNWRARIEKYVATHNTDREADENYLRDLMASAVSVPLDKANRFVVPEKLRVRANIRKEVVFVGMIDRIELWDREAFEKFQAGREGLEEPPSD